MTLQEILDLINQQGPAGPYSGATSASAASVSPADLGQISKQAGQFGAQGGALLGNQFGINSNNPSAQLGGEIGGNFGLLGGMLGDLIGGWIGGGVPREAKTASLGSALTGSGNPLADIIGQFVNKGVGQGHVMSESGSSTFGNSVETLSTFLQALTGQQIPTISGTGFEHNPTFNPPGLGRSGTNFALPQGYQFMDIAKAPDAAKIIEKLVGMSAPGGTPPQGEWQKIVQDLIGKGDLTKYQGPLGAVGASPTSPGANPNISLPHPLAPSPAKSVQPPYPLQAGA